METFLGQILMVGFNFAPQGWALCNGQLLPIAEYTALFSLLGTTYGGNGVTTFALPNLQGRVPIHQGQSGATSDYTMGMSGGVEKVTLLVNNMPAHNHTANCSTSLGANSNPAENFWSEAPSYAPSANAQMAPTAIGTTGGNLPVTIVQPFLCVNFIIALQGIYPARA